MQDNQIAKSNYTLLHNILNNNLCVSKWNPNVKMSCENCGEIEILKHLLYGCNDSSFIWQTISYIVDFVVSQKHIVIGFYKNSDFKNGMNTLILYTAIKMYKYKMKCRLTNSKSDRETLYNCVQSSLKINQYISEKSYDYIQIKKLLKKICIGL